MRGLSKISNLFRAERKWIWHSQTRDVNYVYPAALNPTKVKKEIEISLENKVRNSQAPCMSFTFHLYVAAYYISPLIRYSRSYDSLRERCC